MQGAYVEDEIYALFRGPSRRCERKKNERNISYPFVIVSLFSGLEALQFNPYKFVLSLLFLSNRASLQAHKARAKTHSKTFEPLLAVGPRRGGRLTRPTRM